LRSSISRSSHSSFLRSRHFSLLKLGFCKLTCGQVYAKFDERLEDSLRVLYTNKECQCSFCAAGLEIFLQQA
jgi:hypothetical protein